MANLRARLTRRSVLLGGVGAAAAVCVGCGPERSLTDESTGGADGLVELGELQPLLDRMGAAGRVYLPEARGYLVAYPADKVAAAKDVYPTSIHPSLDLGVLLLSQKCPHLGCRVPECNSSGWFECPCHLSRFSAVGEYREGVSERGMDVIPLAMEAGQRVVADPNRVEKGLARDVDITEQDATGAHCT